MGAGRAVLVAAAVLVGGVDGQGTLCNLVSTQPPGLDTVCHAQSDARSCQFFVRGGLSCTAWCGLVRVGNVQLTCIEQYQDGPDDAPCVQGSPDGGGCNDDGNTATICKCGVPSGWVAPTSTLRPSSQAPTLSPTATPTSQPPTASPTGSSTAPTAAPSIAPTAGTSSPTTVPTTLCDRVTSTAAVTAVCRNRSSATLCEYHARTRGSSCTDWCARQHIGTQSLTCVNQMHESSGGVCLNSGSYAGNGCASTNDNTLCICGVPAGWGSPTGVTLAPAPTPNTPMPSPRPTASTCSPPSQIGPTTPSPTGPPTTLCDHVTSTAAVTAVCRNRSSATLCEYHARTRGSSCTDWCARQRIGTQSLTCVNQMHESSGGVCLNSGSYAGNGCASTNQNTLCICGVPVGWTGPATLTPSPTAAVVCPTPAPTAVPVGQTPPSTAPVTLAPITLAPMSPITLAPTVSLPPSRVPSSVPTTGTPGAPSATASPTLTASPINAPQPSTLPTSATPTAATMNPNTLTTPTQPPAATPTSVTVPPTPSTAPTQQPPAATPTAATLPPTTSTTPTLPPSAGNAPTGRPTVSPTAVQASVDGDASSGDSFPWWIIVIAVAAVAVMICAAIVVSRRSSAPSKPATGLNNPLYDTGANGAVAADRGGTSGMVRNPTYEVMGVGDALDGPDHRAPIGRGPNAVVYSVPTGIRPPGGGDVQEYSAPSTIGRNGGNGPTYETVLPPAQPNSMPQGVGGAYDVPLSGDARGSAAETGYDMPLSATSASSGNASGPSSNEDFGFDSRA